MSLVPPPLPKAAPRAARPTYVIGHKNPDADSICSAIAYAEYKRSIEEIKQEVLPVLQIFSECVNLIQGIQAAVEKDGNTEEAAKQDGDDVLDSAVHLVHNFAFAEEALPRDVFIQNKVGTGF